MTQAGKSLPRLRGVAVPAALLSAFALFYFVLAVHPDMPVFDGDAPAYVLMADYFSPFSDRPRVITELVMRHSHFAPLYPMLLGWLGATSAHLEWAHVLTLGFLLAGLAAYFFWAR